MHAARPAPQRSHARHQFRGRHPARSPSRFLIFDSGEWDRTTLRSRLDDHYGARAEPVLDPVTLLLPFEQPDSHEVLDRRPPAGKFI